MAGVVAGPANVNAMLGGQESGATSGDVLTALLDLSACPVPKTITIQIVHLIVRLSGVLDMDDAAAPANVNVFPDTAESGAMKVLGRRAAHRDLVAQTACRASATCTRERVTRYVLSEHAVIMGAVRDQVFVSVLQAGLGRPAMCQCNQPTAGMLCVDSYKIPGKSSNSR